MRKMINTMSEELDSLKRNQTWVLVDIPKCKQIVKVHFVRDVISKGKVLV